MRNHRPPSPCPELRRALDDVRRALAYPPIAELVAVCSRHAELATLADALAGVRTAIAEAERRVTIAERRGRLRLVHGGKVQEG